MADSVGEVIRRARDAKQLTQRELAKKANITSMYLSQIETGIRSPSVELCKRLARDLDLDEDRLLLILYRAKTPEEFQRLFVHNGQTSASKGDALKKQLLDRIDQLPAKKQNEMLKMIIGMLEVALEEASD